MSTISIDIPATELRPDSLVNRVQPSIPSSTESFGKQVLHEAQELRRLSAAMLAETREIKDTSSRSNIFWFEGEKANPVNEDFKNFLEANKKFAELVSVVKDPRLSEALAPALEKSTKTLDLSELLKTLLFVIDNLISIKVKKRELNWRPCYLQDPITCDPNRFIDYHIDPALKKIQGIANYFSPSLTRVQKKDLLQFVNDRQTLLTNKKKIVDFVTNLFMKE